ncbi:transmembrane channel-like protein 7 [Argonauta hians]
MEDEDDETFSCGLSNVIINDADCEMGKESPALTEHELREAYLYCTLPHVVTSDPEMNTIYAKTLPVRKRRTSSDSNMKARSYSTSVKVGDVVLESLLSPTDAEEVAPKIFKQCTIRFLPRSMTFKKKLWEYIDEEKKLTKFQSWKKEKRQKWKHFKANLRNSMRTWGLWSHSIKVIKGEYGNGMVAFFHFLRWLITLDFILMIIMLCVTTVPFVATSNHLNFSNYLMTSSENWIHNNPFVDQAENCSSIYLDFTKTELNKRKAHEHVKDLLQGTGFMEYTVLFYGVYHNVTMTRHNYSYNMSLAYVLATLAFFFVSFIAIIVNIARGIKKNLINELSTGVPFSQKVLGSWDFCMNNEKIVRSTKTCLLQELRADLASQKENWYKSNRSIKTKIKLYTIRIILNIIIFVVLVGSLALVYYSSTFLMSRDNFSNTFEELLFQFSPSFIISVLNVIIPSFFDFLIKYEDYTSSFEVKLKLLRIVLLRLASVAVLLFSLYDKLIQNKNPSGCNFKNHGEIKCWETYVGQQFYKLIILDFAIVILVNMVMHSLRRIIYNHFHKGEQIYSNAEDTQVADNNRNGCGRFFSRVMKVVGPQEFQLPQNVLDIVYLQSLCWLGTFFSPLSPAIITVQFFIIFYVKRFTLTHNCVQSVRPFRSSNSSSFFMFSVLLSFTLCILPISFVISSIEPSKSCGPFRVYSEVAFSMFTPVYNLVNSWPSVIPQILNFIFTPAIMIPLIVVICFYIYYNFIVVKGHIRMEDLLREQLVLDGMDKRFLLEKLKRYKKISKL